MNPLRLYRWALPALAVGNIVISVAISQRNKSLVELRTVLSERLDEMQSRIDDVQRNVERSRSVASSSSSSPAGRSSSSSPAGRASSFDADDNRPVVSLDASYSIYSAFDRRRGRVEYRLHQHGHDYVVGEMTRYGRITRVSWDCVEFDRAIGYVVRSQPSTQVSFEGSSNGDI